MTGVTYVAISLMVYFNIYIFNLVFKDTGAKIMLDIKLGLLYCIVEIVK